MLSRMWASPAKGIGPPTVPGIIQRVIRPIPSHKAQLLLVNLLTGWPLREIDELFVGNGLTETAQYDARRWPIGTSERRGAAASYLAAVDLGDEHQRVGLLRVFADVLRSLDEDSAQRLAQLLEEDGFRFQSPTRIAAEELRMPEGGRLTAALPDFSTITDPDVLREHAERMHRASVAADAPDAILAARELLESTCKLICEAYDVDLRRSPNLGELYKLAAEPLGLNASNVPEDDPGAAAARKVLSGLVRVADGLGDLRTRIGRGHGHARRSPARQRHADLATGAAAILTIFMLDTWRDRQSR
jgi:hypothetical protein